MSTHRAVMPVGDDPVRRFIRLPTTVLGRICAVLFLAWIAFWVLMGLLPHSLVAVGAAGGGAKVGGLVSFAVVVAVLVTGAIALVGYRERSWAVWLATGFTALLIGVEVVGMVTGKGG